MRDIDSMSRENTLATNRCKKYHAHLGLPDKGRAIKGLIVCNDWIRALGPAKRSGPRLLLTVPLGMNRI